MKFSLSSLYTDEVQTLSGLHTGEVQSLSGLHTDEVQLPGLQKLEYEADSITFLTQVAI